MDNLIEVYENILPKEFCEYIIKTYEDNKELHYPGRLGSGNVVPKIQKSTDANLLHLLDKVPGIKPQILAGIRQSLDQSLVKYFKKYHPTGDPGFLEVLEKPDEDVLNYLRSRYSFFTKAIPMKKYDKQDGGYHAYHEDNGWSEVDMSKVLVCMFYLNDVKEGGETEFLHQKYKVSPTQGSLVIFPAYFTHLHKGHIPISNDKYILNIWLLKHNAAYWRIWHSKNG